MDFFRPSLTLVREDDGEYTLFASTLTPYPNFQAGLWGFETPPGHSTPPDCVPVAIRILAGPGTTLSQPATVHHTVSGVPITGAKPRAKVYTLLDATVVNVAEVSVSLDYRPDFVTVAAEPVSLIIDSAARSLTLDQAGIIVQACVPGPDRPWSVTLGDAVGVSENRLRAFQRTVKNKVKDHGFEISLARIPRSAGDRLRDVRSAVQEHSSRA